MLKKFQKEGEFNLERAFLNLPVTWPWRFGGILMTVPFKPAG
jgi:hypothetical protein